MASSAGVSSETRASAAAESLTSLVLWVSLSFSSGREREMNEEEVLLGFNVELLLTKGLGLWWGNFGLTTAEA